jgi:uncharacterized protein (TIGR02246 family)
MNQDHEADKAAIDDLRRRWLEALADGNVNQLRGLMSEDVVVVHGNGRTVSGRETVVEDLRASFVKWRVNERVEPDELIVSGDWAFERARVWTTVRPVGSNEATEIRSSTFTLLRRDPGTGWRVARAIGVVER